jgi:hypothetical protein
MKEATAKRRAVPDLDPIAADSVATAAACGSGSGMDASTGKQAKKVRRGPAESVHAFRVVHQMRKTLGQAFSWAHLFMVIVTEIRGLKLNQRDEMWAVSVGEEPLSKTLGRLQKFLAGSRFQFVAPFRSDEN